MTERRDDHFQDDWLRLREPVDHRSRHQPFSEELDHLGQEQGWRRVVDLGSGRGSNVRYLAPRLGWAREWTVVDHDPTLLAAMETPAGGRLIRVEGDLRDEGLDAVADAHLVTASALLDLVTRRWIDALAARCRDSGSAALLVLTYDGEIGLEGGEGDPEDEALAAAVNRHQTRKKGMGEALGPGATPAAEDSFRAAGFRCRTAPSRWILSGSGDAPLAEALMQGWVEAAEEVRPDAGPRFRGWLARRVSAFRRGELRITVGHRDLLALPGPDAA